MELKTALRPIVKVLLNNKNSSRFMLAPQSRHVETTDEIRAESISVKKVTFKTSPKLQPKLQVATFEKVK